MGLFSSLASPLGMIGGAVIGNTLFPGLGGILMGGMAGGALGGGIGESLDGDDGSSGVKDAARWGVEAQLEAQRRAIIEQQRARQETYDYLNKSKAESLGILSDTEKEAAGYLRPQIDPNFMETSPYAALYKFQIAQQDKKIKEEMAARGLLNSGFGLQKQINADTGLTESFTGQEYDRIYKDAINRSNLAQWTGGAKSNAVLNTGTNFGNAAMQSGQQGVNIQMDTGNSLANIYKNEGNILAGLYNKAAENRYNLYGGLFKTGVQSGTLAYLKK